MTIDGMLASIRERRAVGRAARGAESAAAEARWKAEMAALQAREAARQATRTIAAQIRAHPLDVSALGVRVDRYEVITPSGRWRLLGTTAKLAARTSRTVRTFGGWTARRTALLIITGPDGQLHEQYLATTEDVRAGELLVAHINARSAALKLPRRR